MEAHMRQAAKMKELQAKGQPGRFVGQIGRAQAFYTVADKPLMHRVFEEDVWPVCTAAATVGVRCFSRVVSGRSCGIRRLKKSCDIAALSSTLCQWEHRLPMRTQRRDALIHTLCSIDGPFATCVYICVLCVQPKCKTFCC